MIFGGGLFARAVIALWIYCILDVIVPDEGLIRNLPRSFGFSRSIGVVAPDDDPRFLAQLDGHTGREHSRPDRR